MSFFKRLFGRKNKINEEATIPITQLKKEVIPGGSKILYQSEVPASLEMGNLNFSQEYEESIKLGKSLLSDNPFDAMAHIQIMVAYFKLRNENEEYFDLSTYHAKQAILCGHNTGYAHERLVINLTRKGMIHQAIQLCDLVLSDNFSFSSHGCGNGHDYNKRKDSLLKRLDKAKDSIDAVLFTEKEIESIYKGIEEDKKQEIKEREDYEKRMAEYDANSEKRREEFRNRLRDIMYEDYKNKSI